MCKEKTVTLTITEREYHVLEYIVVEAFKNAPLSGPDLIAVMTINTKLNKIQDAHGGSL